MTSTLARFRVLAGVAIAVACFAARANAGCLDLRTAPIARLQAAAPHVRTVAFSDDDNDRAPIVGLWRIQFILPGAGPMGEDVVIDDGYFGVSAVSADGFASPAAFPGDAGSFAATPP